MIDYIKGRLAYIGTDYVVLENNSIGYKIFSSLHAIGQCTKDEEVVFYTELIVREDAMLLVGFTQREELEMFQRLTSVSGVGTKVGIAILSHLTFDRVAHLIVSKDVKGLTGAPGVGKKTAERIILELKDKVAAFAADVHEDNISDQMLQNQTEASDALAALVTLGYTKSEAQTVLNGMDLKDMTTEMVIKQALKRLMGQF